MYFTFLSLSIKNRATPSIYLLLPLLKNGEKTKAIIIFWYVPTDLSKAFDYTPHDLGIAKSTANGFDKNMLRYIYSYLKSRKQCVNVNKTKSTFELII